MLQFEKTIEMNATYAFYLPPFRQKKTGISKQMEIPVKSESIYEFLIAQRLTESKVALCFNSLHYLLFHRGPTRAIVQVSKIYNMDLPLERLINMQNQYNDSLIGVSCARLY